MANFKFEKMSTEEINETIQAIEQLKKIKGGEFVNEELLAKLDALEAEVAKRVQKLEKKLNFWDEDIKTILGDEDEDYNEESSRVEREPGPEYEVKEFTMTLEEIKDKKITLVEVDVPENFKIKDQEENENEEDTDEENYGEGLSGVISKYHGYYSYGDLSKYAAEVAIQVEGIDGVLIATSYNTDEYRSSFDRWYLVKGLDARQIEDLGTAKDLRSRTYTPEYSSNQTTETIIKTSKGKIRYGTEEIHDYYPRGFCQVET